MERTQQTATQEVRIIQISLSQAAGNHDKGSLYALLSHIGYFLPDITLCSIPFLASAYISIQPLPMRSRIQLPPRKCKGTRKKYLEIAFSHNPTIMFSM
ncbi:unnamed protein product [Blepharisma stoltei]|uniref:Uncharacterized protein n=1 Tax=Blepharisma stoltei TaxID=1481888 RepID=A0AAU9JVL2_9CILI|nr:unnamed protein product [Blepharisma stoltei]CAG9325777.1 unnamed protein product [Blepharisma stoltei]